ncbi:PAS domain S-box protein [Variovorax dokdonensis]|uniref:histidine kinase n=1 Tax=Variovorax dokdonensis TaxID=344883 RepID=A0ABT7N9R4_9BURK|nr:PAS domain S-box protein [Variovorax dokdonensis]MDM0044658.1 PAS domain S-box protein [Variovorax dokdonensis]
MSSLAKPDDALPSPLWRRAAVAYRRLRTLWQRWFLWALLALLVMALVSTVVWLAGRHEVQQVQEALERDVADAAVDLRNGLQRNAQSLRALNAAPDPQRWADEARELLRLHREWLRIEWLNPNATVREGVITPYRVPVLDNFDRRPDELRDIRQLCHGARTQVAAAYSPSRFTLLANGGGIEVMQVCVPMDDGSYVLAAYGLRDLLSELVAPSQRRGQEVSLVEPDGTRLAVVGAPRRSGTRVFTALQPIELPGVRLLLRIDGWRAAPDLFPNVLTGLVTFISIALVSVLILLARDTRRRQKAERDLAESLAFRKAMEDSVVTGLRARDLQGRITYVNPAFCEMVGFSAEELMGQHGQLPYWPTELAHEYEQRQAVRLAGTAPPREGFESVFMRKDGRRFPVLIFEAPLINAQQVQTGWMSAFVDLSEQRRVEELSRASQERLQASARLATVGEMASLLSHELTQPLAAISSYATGSLNLLEPAAQSASDDLRMALTRIADQATRAGRVIRSVHDFVRRRERAREATRPGSLVDAVLPLVQLQARKLGVRIELNIAKALPAVMCDRTLVEQVLLNLARNGMQAMDSPQIVRRELRLGALLAQASRSSSGEGRRWVEFMVADIGVGIDEDVAQRLFTPFFTTRGDGMGLGLSLCRTVVEQHGGALTYEPNLPCGTIFRFTLPAADGSPSND